MKSQIKTLNDELTKQLMIQRDARKKAFQTLQNIGAFYVMTRESDSQNNTDLILTIEKHREFNVYLKDYRQAIEKSSSAELEILNISEQLKQLREERSQ